ncbi:hypothetical protein FVB13_08045 [Escherichia coli]|uniref:hypothetical protein n=1 Tax=Escherichia coli TaxID=562 RepID=UPI00128E7D1F|nr:hypothetical protein [Escherichia coli]MPU29098.1 hypothetical protein [Escherichia coli]MPU39495.1 hypothetical protein [Escherichia coli]
MPTLVYITRYALTTGAFSVEAEILDDGNTAAYFVGYEGKYISYAHSGEFWFSESEAIADCERRRSNKLNSLEKKIKKLKSINFNVGIK